MRRGGTVLVMVVVAAIALAAGFDALRGEPEPVAKSDPEPPAVSTTTTAPEAPAPEAAFGGVLYYTDESCELQAAELPALAPAQAPNWDECRFVLSPDGERVAAAGSGWDPHSDRRRGRLFEAEDGLIQVSTNGGPEGEPFRGEAPAWRPDGTLTYFADGAVREWPGGDVVLSQRELLRAVRRDGVPFRSRLRSVSLREAAWLDDRRLAVLMSTQIRRELGAGQDMLAIYEDDRLATWRLYEQDDVSDLRVSPRGTFLAVRYGRRFDMLDNSGESIDTLGIVGYRSIAWSPNEQWVAVPADGGLFVFRPGSSGPPLQLELDAHDLAWRGEAGPPALVDADDARDWLGGVGGTGRLFVTLPGCRLRALRLPDLAWEEEPDVRAPCRFTLTPNDAPLDEAVSVSPTGELRALCEHGSVRVFQNGGFRTSLPGACGPAWMGDGTLTFVRNGGLWQGIEDARPLVSRQLVSELFGRRSAFEEVAWVDDERFWAVVRSGESAIVALMTTDRLVSSPSFTTRTIEGLRVSATGMVAARTDQGVVFFDTGGRRALTFPNGRSVAWAPDGVIAAVATSTEVLFVAPVSREVVTLPLAVRDLEWVVP